MYKEFVLSVLALTLFAFQSDAIPDHPQITIDIEPGPNPWSQLDFKDDPNNFQFAIVTDRTGGARPGVFEDALSKLNLLQPEFVMSVGDLIQGGIEDVDEINRQWDEFEGFTRGLEMPFFYLPGNHDISNSVMADVWKKRHGKAYHHFVYRDVLFLCLNTEDPKSHIGEEQIAYVKKTLEENQDVRWTLVFLHRPLWGDDEENGWRQVEELLQGRKYRVTAGHWHSYVKYERKDTTYLVLATCGGGSRLRGPVFGEFDHVVWVTMTDEGPIFANLMLEGIWDENIRTEEMATTLRAAYYGKAVGGGSVVLAGEDFSGADTKLRIENTADVPMKVSGAFQANEHLAPSPASFDVTVAPNSIEWIPVRVEAAQWGETRNLSPLAANWKIEYKFPQHKPVTIEGVHRVIFDANLDCPAKEGVKVDGDLSEWDGDLDILCVQPAQITNRRELWKGPDDASFRFGVARDEDYIYVGVETKDDESMAAEGNNRDFDGVEVLFDSRPGGEGASEPLTLTARWDEDETSGEGGAQVATRNTEQGQVAEFAIPIQRLVEKQGADWKSFRLNVLLRDRDVEGRATYLWWRPDWNSPANLEGSGIFGR